MDILLKVKDDVWRCVHEAAQRASSPKPRPAALAVYGSKRSSSSMLNQPLVARPQEFASVVPEEVRDEAAQCGRLRSHLAPLTLRRTLASTGHDAGGIRAEVVLPVEPTPLQARGFAKSFLVQGIDFIVVLFPLRTALGNSRRAQLPLSEKYAVSANFNVLTLTLHLTALHRRPAAIWTRSPAGTRCWPTHGRPATTATARHSCATYWASCERWVTSVVFVFSSVVAFPCLQQVRHVLGELRKVRRWLLLARPGVRA